MEAGDSPQLWSPPTTLFIPVRRRHGHISPILNPEALILTIPILVLLIAFLILPPFLSCTNHQILKPISFQKGWDSINTFLVSTAVLCGVFAKRNDEKSSSPDADGQKNLDAGTNVSDDNIRKSIASSKWLDFLDKSEYDKMRNSRSYPDLRHESLWGCESNEFNFFDDFEVNFHRQPEKRYHRRSQKVEKEDVAEPAPLPQPVQRRRSVHRGRNNDENKSPLPPPLPPPEPEFIPVAERTERIQREKSGTTKEIATATASLQYGTQTQRTKKVKRRDIYESAAEDSLPPSTIAPPSTPPPPPPPPPSKGFQSLLKKSSKSKRVHSVSTTAKPPPPPPPPPPNSIFANIFKTGSKSKRSQLFSASSHPPPPPPYPPYSIFNNIFSMGSKSQRCQIPSASSQPLPPQPSPQTSSILISSFENLTKTRRFKNSDSPAPPLPPPEIRPVNTGKPPKPPKQSTSHNENDIIVAPSPLIPVPSPPTPPPFRMPEINFVPKGDFARKGSTNSSQGSSPKLDVDVMLIESESGQSIRPSVSCPSPDVNMKADTFISRLRDGWRLEKLNSINERQNSVSTSSRL
ncbi:uncharacterized protein [Primulina eburnea]|uniref:uncharacterized protein n=1 Tax=Primulina eburnea TaxID=1245227 RepID=UPI003C6C3EA5